MRRIQAKVEELLILTAATVVFVFVGFASAVMMLNDRRAGHSA